METTPTITTSEDPGEDSSTLIIMAASGSGGAVLPTDTNPPDTDPVYDNPTILAFERFQDGDQLVLFSSTDETQTYLGLM